MNPGAALGRWRLLALACVAGMGLGSTCESYDVVEAVDLNVARTSDADGDHVQALQLAEIGRMSLDYELRAPAGKAATLRLDAQVQTSGRVDEAACDALAAGAAVVTPAVQGATASSLPTEAASFNLRALDTAYRIAVTASPTGRLAYVRFTPPGSEVAALDIYVASESVSPLVRTRDTPVEPDSVRAFEPECNLAGNVYRFLLEGGVSHFVGFPSFRTANYTMVLEQACEEGRAVPATCAGHTSEVVSPTEVSLAAGGVSRGHVSASSLGLGDRLVLGLHCDASDGPCAGEATVTIRADVVECLSSANCGSSQTCSAEGYCTGDAGCSAGSRRSGGWLALVAAALGLGRVRRLRRARPLVAGAGLFAGLLGCMCLFAPSANAATGAEMYAEGGLQSRLYSGELGSLLAPGLGAYARQGVQSRFLGGALTLSTDYYLTSQDPPPYGASLQTFTIAAGPRGRVPLRGWDLLIAVDAERVNVIANPLVRWTGTATGFWGASASVTARLPLGRLFYGAVLSETRITVDEGAARLGFGVGLGLGISTGR